MDICSFRSYMTFLDVKIKEFNSNDPTLYKRDDSILEG